MGGVQLFLMDLYLKISSWVNLIIRKGILPRRMILFMRKKQNDDMK